jgi:hypothetical protein
MGSQASGNPDRKVDNVAATPVLSRLARRQGLLCRRAIELVS